MPEAEGINQWIAYGPRRLRLSVDVLRFDRHAIQRCAGHANDVVAPFLENATEEALRLARTLVTPTVVFDTRPATCDGGILVVATPSPVKLSVGEIIGDQLAGAAAVAVFLVTIGAALEGKARQLLQDDALAGYLLDAAGSVAAEETADVLEAELQGQLKLFGWCITNRFSPGYCSWPTTDQRSLFSLLSADDADVRLTDSCLMQPLKSISGIIGLGPNVQHNDYPCALCDMPGCHRRLTDTATPDA